jgi:DNA polymerase III subunit gamma/tau
MAGYLVLARKYRPRRFDDVLGQEVVTSVLRGALQEGRIGHAYLFAGPRGTGKTTLARILARCLNCAEGPTPDPCGVCEQCLGIEAGNDPDLVEIDAATHTGVDHIRELREQAAYAPMRARSKIYIVDEVHMLSKAAFNALLKTLEEPPPHVVFLFATTELHKVLPTIVSRCQVLKLSPVRETAIVERLQEVLRSEGVTPGPGLLEELARGARGGMRDALSLTDKLLSLAGGEPTLEDLRRLGGHTGAREIDALCSKIEAGDKRGVLEAVSNAEGMEAELISALLLHLRTSLVAAFCGVDSPLLPAEDDARSTAVERSRRLSGERVELWMQELLAARERMRTFPGQERLVLELALLDLARPETTLPLAELEARLAALEAGEPPAAAAPAAAPGPAQPARAPAPSPRAAAPVAAGEPDGEERWPEPDPAPPPEARRERAPAEPAAAPAGQKSELRIFEELVQALAARNGTLAELLRAGGTLRIAGEVAALELKGLDASSRALVDDRRNRAALRRALEEVAGRPLELRIGSDEPGPARGPKPAATSHDPFTREVADLFGGVIEDLS